MKNGKQRAKVTAKAKKGTRAEHVAPEKGEPMVAFGVQVAQDAPSIRARKGGKAESGRVQRTKSNGHIAKTAKSKPINGAKVETPKGAKPAARPQRTGRTSPKQEAVLADLEGSGFVASLIEMAALSPKELKEWKEYNLDTCSTPNCGRPSVYVVESVESAESVEADEESDALVYCRPCTRAKLGLKT